MGSQSSSEGSGEGEPEAEPGDPSPGLSDREGGGELLTVEASER